MIPNIILVLSIIIDCFIAAFIYGSGKIKIPIKCIIIISIICTLSLTLSIVLSSFISFFIPNNICKIISFIILLSIGIVSLFKNTLKTILEKKQNLNKKIYFHINELNFILNIFIDEKKADIDNSKILNIKESILLSIALSFDSIAIGIGIGFSLNILSIIFISIFSFLLHIIFIIIGFYCGNKFSEKINLNISWLSGLLLIILSFIRFF